MSLRRACLGCGALGHWRSRCPRCQAEVERRKAARRPERRTWHEQQRNRRAVTDHRARFGDWCPGVPELGRPAHPAANLSADHVTEVAAGGPESGPLVVRCVPCNSARSANVRRRVLVELGVSPQGSAAPPPRPSKFGSHSAAP